MAKLHLVPTTESSSDFYMPGCVRLSTLVGRLRESGSSLAEKLVVAGKKFVCTDCGRAEPDPVVGLREPESILLGCPHCCGSAVRDAWLSEAPS